MKQIKKIFSAILTMGILISGIGAASAQAESSFRDVPIDIWYQNHVEFTVEKGLFKGTPEGNFEPKRGITRGEMVTVMGRLYELMTGDTAEAAGQTSGFSDVDEDQYYAGAIAWAAENGLIKGYPDGTFQPDALIDRESFAVIMDRYLTSIGAELTVSVERLCGESTVPEVSEVDYVDEVEISDWAKAAVEYLYTYDVLNGVYIFDRDTRTGVYEFQPDRAITRAETAVIITRVYQAVMFVEDTEISRDVIAFSFEGEEKDLFLPEQGWEIITEYACYEDLLNEMNNFFAGKEIADYQPLDALLTAEYFETGAVLVIERQVVGCPINEMRLVDCSITDNIAEITMFVDSHGSTSDVFGHLYLIEIPQTVTDVQISWEKYVHELIPIIPT